MLNDKELYEVIQQQFPNPYTVYECYHIEHETFPKPFIFFACKNSKGFIRIFKVVASNTKIGIEAYRFTKKKELVYIDTYVLKQGRIKDEDDYNYFKKLLDNTKNICYNAKCKE